MKVMVCRWCGDRLETVTDEPGVYTHEKDGYFICWAAPNGPDGMGRNAEPHDPTVRARCPGCDNDPVGYAPHNGQGDCPPKSTEQESPRG